MTALARPLRIPCRYVSGYLFHREAEDGPKDRSLEGASHAWVEALVPRLGWTAFDPTNNLIGGDRHIRVAIGRDYADVPPTRGVYKGEARSELSVAVTVSPSDAPPPEHPAPSIVIQSRPVFSRLSPRSDQSSNNNSNNNRPSFLSKQSSPRALFKMQRLVGHFAQGYPKIHGQKCERWVCLNGHDSKLNTEGST